MWLNACSSSLSVESGILSVATFSMFIGLPVSIPLSTVSLAGVSVSGVAMALTKKYQKKLMKVTKLVDIMTLALAVFETSVSKPLNNGRIDEREFTMLQTFHLGTFNGLAIVDHKKRQDKSTFPKSIFEEINNLKKAIRDALYHAHSSPCAILCVTTATKINKL